MNPQINYFGEGVDTRIVLGKVPEIKETTRKAVVSAAQMGTAPQAPAPSEAQTTFGNQVPAQKLESRFARF